MSCWNDLNSVPRRFWARVDRANGCWLWSGSRNYRGYGKISSEKTKYDLAHRVSWRLHNGDIPPGMMVCHRCDNPPCVNPSHLFLGTALDNVRDCKRKGRRRIGSQHWAAKLNEKIVREIKMACILGESQADVARQYGVGKTLVNNIVRYGAWAQVEP